MYIYFDFTASVKRSHENWFSGNGGFWEDHKASTSPASRSAEANSPSSSNVSVRKKMVSLILVFSFFILRWKIKG